MKLSYDIYFRQTLCGTSWARWVEGANDVCIECFLKYYDVPEIGLQSGRKKSIYTFSADGRPRAIEMTDDLGSEIKISITDQALNYGKGEIPVDAPIEFATEANMVPLLAIWWAKFHNRKSGTFKTLVAASGAVFDYELKRGGNTLTTGMGGTYHLDADGEIAEARADRDEFVTRRGQRRFPNWTFKTPSGKGGYVPPSDLNIEDVTLSEGGRDVEATIARPFEGLTAVAVFIGGTGIYGRHGITPIIDIGYHQLLDDLARLGIASVRYEKIDPCASNPVEAEGAVDFGTLCTDAERWFDWLADQPWATGVPRVVIGHSMGGIVGLSLAAKRPDIAVSVLLSTPGRPLKDVIQSQITWNQTHSPTSKEAADEGDRMHQALLKALALDEEWTEDNVDKRLLPLKHKRRFLRSVIDLDPCDLIGQSTSAMLVVHGDEDVQVLWDDALLLQQAAVSADREVAVIKANGLDHLLKRNEATGFAALKAYQDRRRRVPIGLIRQIATKIETAVMRGSGQPPVHPEDQFS